MCCPLLIVHLSIFLRYPLPLTFACTIIPPFSTSHLQQEEGQSVPSHIHPQTPKPMCVYTPSHTQLPLLPVFSWNCPPSYKPFLSLSMPQQSSLLHRNIKHIQCGVSGCMSASPSHMMQNLLTAVIVACPLAWDNAWHLEGREEVVIYSLNA